MNRDLLAIQVMEAAIDLPNEERDAYVLDACEGDSKLLRKVRALLDAAADEASFLATRSDDSASEVRPPTRERIGSYRIVREIGRGGMGIVYEAEHDAMQRRVALKVLSAGSTPSDNQLARFYREARAAGQLHHTNIVPVFEVGSADGWHYYTMQFIDGANFDVVIDQIRALRDKRSSGSREPGRTVAERLLADVSRSPAPGTRPPNKIDVTESQRSDETCTKIQRFDSTDSVFASPDSSSSSKSHDAYFRRIAAMGIQVSEALDYAHQSGTLHRDIKPANLIIDTHGIVWVLDFGLAKSGQDDLTVSGDVVGTIRYMAPERFDGMADARSDVYSLGLTLYELATLQYAFDATDRSSLIKQVTSQNPRSPRAVNQRVPRDLETIILKSLDRSPSRRYQTAAEMADDLRLFVMDHPIAARRISPFERAWRVCRRNPVVSSMAASLLALLVLIAVGSAQFAYVSNQQKHQALQAERSTRNRRYELNYQSAQAIRQSHRVGRRFDSLASVQEAVNLLPTLNFSHRDLEEERAKLRTEAAAAMGLFDMHPQRTWPARTETERSVAFSADYTHYAQPTAGRDEIRIYAADDETTLRTLHADGDQASVLAFSSNARFLISKHRGDKTRLNVWDVGGMERFRNVERGQRWETAEPMISIESHYGGTGALSADGKTVAISQNNGIAVYDLPSGRLRITIPTDYAPTRIQLSEDGDRLAACGLKAKEIEIWDTRNASVPAHVIVLPEDVHGTGAFAWSTDRNVLVVGTYDGSILLWRNGLDKPAARFPLHKHTITRIHIHPHQPLIFTDGWDDTVRVFDLVTERQVCRLERHALQVGGFNADGSLIGISSVEHQRFGVWHVAEPCLKQFRLDLADLDATAVYRAVKFHPNCSTLMLAAHDKRIAFYDTARQTLLRLLPGHDSSFMEFSADGNFLYVFAAKSSVRIPLKITSMQHGLELETGEPEPILKPLPGANRFELSHGQQLLIVVFNENTAHSRAELLSFTDGKLISRFEHPLMSSAAISPDGKWVVTSNWKGQGARVWNALTGRLEIDLLPETSGTFGEFSQDGKFLVVSQFDNVDAWHTGSWEPLNLDVGRKHGIMGDLDFTKRLFVADNTRYTSQLIDIEARRWLMHLIMKTEDTQRSYSFSKDESQLAIGGTEFTHVWNLEEVRTRLADMGLGW